MRKLWLACLVLAACGGNKIKEDALKRAQRAREVGDLPAEALALQQACAADLKDRKVCARADAAKANALAALRVAAGTQCNLAEQSIENMDRCVAALSSARQLATADAEIEQIADRAGRAQAAYCNSLVSSQPPRPMEAIRLARCAVFRESGIATSAYATWVTGSKEVAAASLFAATAEPGLASSPAAVAALADAASCLSQSAKYAQAAAKAAAQVAVNYRARLRLAMSGPLQAGDVCARVENSLNDRASCTSESLLAPLLEYQLGVQVGAVSRRVSTQAKEQEYVARIDRRQNPDYQNAVDDERFAREQLRQAEETHRRDEADCRSAESALSRAGSCSSCSERTEKDRACNREDASQSTLDSRKNDHRNAEEKVRNTPQTIEVKIMDTARWVERTYTWSANWHAALSTPSGPIGTFDGQVDYTDRERPAVPQVNIAQDPLIVPENGWQNVDTRDQLVASFSKVVAANLASEGEKLGARCSGPLQFEGGFLTCWTKRNMYSGRAVDGAALLLAASSSDADPRAGQLPALSCRQR